MADKNVDSLTTLFDNRAMFTHMGGTWGKTQELATIKSGGIWYKKAFVYETDVRVFGDSAVVLSDMDLVAVVGPREVTNPFMVTEVYVKEGGKWKLAQLTFSHLLRDVKVKHELTVGIEGDANAEAHIRVRPESLSHWPRLYEYDVGLRSCRR